ncbi:MAG: 2'-5' RNA ligase family protein [Nocardioides sp.]
MPRLHALELLPDAEGEAVVRRDWQALRDAGLPSMLDHTGGTNTPHLTVLALPSIDEAVEQQATAQLGAVLPVVVRPSGVALLSGEKVSVVRLLDVPASLTDAVHTLRDAVTGDRHPGWLPHLTLGRRISRSDAQRAIDAVGYADVSISLVGLRRWNPEQRTVRSLLPGR